MRGNGKVFISHTHADNALCQPLLAALDAWGVDYWFDTQQLEPGQHLSERLQQAIRDRDIFVRICTANTAQSYWMTLEQSAFRSLQLGDQQGTAGGGKAAGSQRGQRGRQRVIVNLVLDPRFVPGPADAADYVVEAYHQSQAQTLAQLRAIFALPQVRAATSRAVSRRTAVGLGAAGVVALAAVGGAGTLYVEKSRATATPYPKPQVIAFDNPQTLDPRVQWYFRAGDQSNLGLALAGDTIYLSSDDGIYALKPADGSIIWASPRFAGGSDEPPIVAGGLLYIADVLSVLYAINTSDGSQAWTNQNTKLLTGTQFTVAGGVIYVLTADGAIATFNAATGAALWSAGNVGKPTLQNLGPTVANGTVYVGGPKGLFAALSTTDGSTRWTYQAGDEIDARPLVANGLVYFGSNDHSLYALDATTGALIWRYTDQSDVPVPIGQAPVIAGKTAYIGIGTDIYAFDAAGGKLLWKAPAGNLGASGLIEDDGDDIYGQPAIVGNTLYVIRGPALYAMDLAKQTILWKVTAPASGFGSSATPIVSGSTAYFAANNHTLYALSAT